MWVRDERRRELSEAGRAGDPGGGLVEVHHWDPKPGNAPSSMRGAVLTQDMERWCGAFEGSLQVDQGPRGVDEQREGGSETRGGRRRRIEGIEGRSRKERSGGKGEKEGQRKEEEEEGLQFRREGKEKREEREKEGKREEKGEDEAKERAGSPLRQYRARSGSRFPGESSEKRKKIGKTKEEEEEKQLRRGGRELLGGELQQGRKRQPGDEEDRRRRALRRTDNGEEDGPTISGVVGSSLVHGGSRNPDDSPRNAMVRDSRRDTAIGSTVLSSLHFPEDARANGQGVQHLVLCPGLGNPGEGKRDDGCAGAEVEVPGLDQSGDPLLHFAKDGTAAGGSLPSCQSGRNTRSCENASGRAEGGPGRTEKSSLVGQSAKATRRRKREEQRRKREERQRQRRQRKRQQQRRSGGEEELREAEDETLEDTPKLGDGSKGNAPVAGDERKEGIEDFVDDRYESAVSSAGGAAGLTIRTGAKRAWVSLRENIMKITSRFRTNSFSLLQVGPMLLQCMKSCCKSLSMANGETNPNFQDYYTLAGTEQCDPTRAEWECSVLLALGHLSGEDFSRRGGLFTESEMRKSVRVQLERFDIWNMTCEAKSFEQFFQHKSIDYVGEEVKLAQDVVWEAVANSFPKEVGRLQLEDFCNLGTKEFVLDFDKYLLPEELQECMRPPRVMVDESEWLKVAGGLLQAGICEVIPLRDVYSVRGSPVLNGMFAVGKGEYTNNLETQRLIMNLTPVNALVRELKGDVCTLPMLSNMGLLVLGANEQCLVSSEDIRCFFYLFRTPKCWHRYMAFNKLLDDSLKPQKWKGIPCVLTSVVLPMGFTASVGIAQHVHRRVINEAYSQMKSPVGGEGEIRRDQAFPQTHDRYRIYLDNYDQLEIFDQRMAEVVKGTVSDRVGAVRQAYERLGLPRHPKKSVSRQLRAEVQGSLLMGDMGVAVPKPQKIMQYLGMALLILQRGECKLKELQVVCGGLVYFTSFRKPLLCGLNEVWKAMEEMKKFPPVINHPLSDKVVSELVRFLCLLPLAQISMRVPTQGMVTCREVASATAEI